MSSVPKKLHFAFLQDIYVLRVGEPALKVLSSEMDMAEIRFIWKAFIK